MEEESSDVESGGAARWKRRRRDQQHGRPAGANPNSFDKAGWEAMLLKLAAFKAEHGHCRPRRMPTPAGSRCRTPGRKADPKLGRWVIKQRIYKKRLDASEPNPGITEERVAKLEAMGIEWSPPNSGGTNEAGWETMRTKLVAFHADHGHCWVPHNHPADPKLGKWVGDQRQYKRKLAAGLLRPCITAERVAKLEALGFEWNPEEAVWEAMRAKLAAFKVKHPADPKLGRWVGKLRKYKG